MTYLDHLLFLHKGITVFWNPQALKVIVNIDMEKMFVCFFTYVSGYPE